MPAIAELASRGPSPEASGDAVSSNLACGFRLVLDVCLVRVQLSSQDESMVSVGVLVVADDRADAVDSQRMRQRGARNVNRCEFAVA